MRYVPAMMIVLALLDGTLHFSIDAFVNKTFTNLPYGPLFVALPIGYLTLDTFSQSCNSTAGRRRLCRLRGHPAYCVLLSHRRTLQPFPACDDSQANRGRSHRGLVSVCRLAWSAADNRPSCGSILKRT
jgi:hypothetical protein